MCLIPGSERLRDLKKLKMLTCSTISSLITIFDSEYKLSHFYIKVFRIAAVIKRAF